MTQFIDMIESGRKATNEFNPERVAAAVAELDARCIHRGKLEVEGVWRLHRSEALSLEQEVGYRPPGGWRALCSLLVGTGVLRAEEDGFVAGPESQMDWLGNTDEVRLRLLQSFTKWLIPPATAAGFFLAMGIHPLWGLRLARRLHVDSPMLEGPIQGWRDEELLPDEDLGQLRKGVFAALSVIVSGLRKLRPDERYGLQGLVGFVGEAIVFGREQIEESGDGLEVLINDIGESVKAQARSTEFAAREFFDGVLVPAGIMRRYDDDTFAVDSVGLENLRVGHLGRDAQRTWFQCFLVGTSAELVA